MTTLRDIVYTQTTGYRTIANTNWPIVRQVRRNGPREWIAETIVNGVAENARTLPTKREAIVVARGSKVLS